MKKTIVSVLLLSAMNVFSQENDTIKTTEIQTVSLQGNKNFRGKKSDNIARLPLENMENPTVYSVVPKELMSEMNATDFNTAVASVPGVVVNNSVNDNGNDVFMRGFRATVNFRNGLSMNPRVQSEIANVERVEVLKGPSGTLFGGTLASYGGVVNTITKKPKEDFGGLISYTTGSWGLNRITADINAPLNKSKTALSRFNVAAYTQNSFQDAGFNKGLFFSGSIMYHLNDKTTLRLDTELHTPEKTLNAYVRNSEGLKSESMKDLKGIHDRAFTSNDISTKRTNFLSMAEIEHRFNDQWISKTLYQRGEANENHSIFLVLSYKNDNEVVRQIRTFDNLKITSDNIQQNFIGDFKIGNFRNRLVVGFDYYHQKDFTAYPMYEVPNRPNGFYFVPFDVVKLDESQPWKSISRSEVENLKRKSTENEITEFSTISAYASDVFSITDSFHVMASLRVDRYKNHNAITNGVEENDEYSQTQLSPKFGLVYEIVKDQVTAFANYVNGFRNFGPSANQDGVTTKWEPEQGNQWEGGFKFDVFNKKLLATISYYNLDVKNRLIADPSGLGSRQDGRIKSQGVDAEIIANPLMGLNIIAGYGYNDNIYDDRSNNNGKKMTWSPRHVANLWTSYKISEGHLEGLGFGMGINYVDKTKMNQANSFHVPAYTLVGATAFYDRSKYRIGLKINNILNETYWNFYGQPQKPREIFANFAFKF